MQMMASFQPVVEEPVDVRHIALTCRAAPNGQGTHPSQGTYSTSSWVECRTCQKPARLGAGGVGVECGVEWPSCVSLNMRPPRSHGQEVCLWLPHTVAWTCQVSFYVVTRSGAGTLASISKVVAELSQSRCFLVGVLYSFVLTWF